MKKLKQLPEMAHFARAVMQSLLPLRIVETGTINFEDLSPEQLNIYQAHKIEGFHDKAGGTEIDREIAKSIDSFGCRLPRVAYYDVLREGLAALFILADRHLHRISKFGSEPRLAQILPNEEKEVAARAYSYKHPCLDFSAHIKTTRMEDPCQAPESLLPKSKGQFIDCTDLNHRIETVIATTGKFFSFMTPVEEHELITFVQKDPATHVAELLTFFQKNLHKLASAQYQRIFEHLLFGLEGSRLLDHLLENDPDSLDLLFHFFENGCDELLERAPAAQVASATLMHLHLRLALWEGGGRRFKTLFGMWERLIEAGQNNPVLGSALGEAVFAALASLEFAYPSLQSEPQFLQLVTTTLLLSCLPGEYIQVPYSDLLLHYGYFSFKALMKRSSDAIEIWGRAAVRVLGPQQGGACHWIEEKDLLLVGSIKINLLKRTIEGADELSMRPLPKEIIRDWDFKKIFGERNFLAHFREENNLRVYAFKTMGSCYEVSIDVADEVEIYKEIDGVMCQRSMETGLPFGHYFGEGHFFWKRGDDLFLEEQKTGRIVAAGRKEGLFRLEGEKSSEEVLVKLDGDQESFLKTLLTRAGLLNKAVIWSYEGSICRIELPKLGITFFQEMVEGQEVIHCQNFPGFNLAKEQRVSFLKNFCGALILENGKGQKKVVVPVAFMKDGEYVPYAERAILSSESHSQDIYLTFDLENSEEFPLLSPHPSHHGAILWLIFLYLRTRQYGRALALIQETDLTSYRFVDSLTLKILNDHDFWLDEEKHLDGHPYAVSIRLMVRAWGYALNHGQEDLRKTDLDSHLLFDLDRYQDQPHAHGVFRLSEPTLRGLLARAENMRHDPFSYSPSGKYCGLDRIDCPEALRKEMVRAYDENLVLPVFSWVSPGEEFVLHFLRNLQLILQGSKEEKEPLLRHLYLTCDDPNLMIGSLSRFLILCHKNPQIAPTFDQIYQLFASDSPDGEVKNRMKAFVKGPENKMIEPYDYLHDRKSYLDKESIRGEKPIRSPRDLPLMEGFSPLFPITLPQAPPPVDFSALEGGFVARESVDFEQDLASAGELLTWAERLSEELTDEPVICAQFSRLREGAKKLIGELTTREKSREVVRGPVNIATFDEEIARRSKELEEREKEILAKANDLHGHRALMLEFGKELRTPFTIEILLIALGRGDLSAIRNSNPSLTNEEIKEIMQELARYAYLRSDLQQLKRARKSLDDSPEDYFMHARAERAFDGGKYPQLLVFEVLSDVTIRKEQVEALLSLKDWRLFEARTGFGKSKVLLPLWLLISAQESLAIFISDSTLFAEQERYLQTVLKKGYHFFAVTIPFSRNSSSCREEIQRIEERLRKAERERRPVFMSDRTAHNLFVLKPKELAQMGSPDLPAFLSLRRYVRGKRVYVDEPQKVLNDIQESNYSVGMPTFIETKRLEFEVELYRQFFHSIEGKYQVEFWDSYGKPPLTEEVYRREILPILLEKFPVDPAHLDYLAGKLNFQEQKEFEAALTDPSVRLLHDQLHYFLPQTIQRNCAEHYSLVDPEKDRTAIPLEDARNPKQGNEFVSIDQMLNFTVQANLKTPFSLDYLRAFFDQLGKLAGEETEATGRAVKKTKAYRQFLLLIAHMAVPPSGLLTMTSKDLERLHEHINTNISAKLNLILYDVLPKVRHFNEKVVSTPHLLVNCFDDVVGASGTLSMQHFPYRLRLVTDEQAMAKTVMTLLRKKTSILAIEDSTRPLHSLREGCPASSVIIEIGASLRQYPDLVSLGREILELYPEFEGFATFDDQGYPVVMKRGSGQFVAKEVCGIAADKLFWFFGQKDITGRDEKLPLHAQASVFVNEETTLTKLLQGIGRMRGFFNGQTATIFIDKRSAFLIRQVLGRDATQLLDLVEYCVLREGRVNGLATSRSLVLQSDALIENFFWDEALRSTAPEEVIIQQFREIREYLVESTEDVPLLRPSFTMEPVETSITLPLLREAFQKKVKAIVEKGIWKLSTIDLEELERKRKAVEENMLYPRKVFFHHAINATQTVETTAEQVATRQAETFTQAEEETEATSESETMGMQFVYVNTLKEKKSIPHKEKITPYSISQIFSHKRLAKYLPLFEGMDLWISENALTTFEGDSPDAPGFVNGYMKPLHYIAGMPDGRLVMIDSQEAAEILEKREIPFLYLVNQGPIFMKKGAKLPGELKKIEVMAKILNGDLRLNAEQKELMRGKEEMLKQFASEILVPLHPDLMISME